MATTYLRAAERVEDSFSLCCCYAISEIEPGRHAENLFGRLFRPQHNIDYRRGIDYDAYFMRMGMDHDEDDIRNRRVVALCLAAAICCSGGSLDFAGVE